MMKKFSHRKFSLCRIFFRCFYETFQSFSVRLIINFYITNSHRMAIISVLNFSSLAVADDPSMRHLIVTNHQKKRKKSLIDKI